MSTVVITGINGQDGSYLAESLLRDGHNVVGFVRRSSIEDKKLANIEHLLKNQRLTLENGDLTDASSVWRLVQDYKPECFYNLGAQSHVGASFTSPQSTMEINTTGVLNCLEAIRNLSPNTHFYQASTSEMFGDNMNAPQNENSVFSPNSPYAVSKVAAHNLVVNYRKAYGLHLSSGILFNHESERRGEQFVTRKITKAAARIKLEKQFGLSLGNLEARRDWGYAPEYVEGMRLITQAANPGDYVLATGETHTIRDFINFVSDAAGFDLMSFVTVSQSNMRPSEVPLLQGDANKAKSVLGWEPKIKAKELAKIMYNADLALETNNVK
jgi:GDPmannose 4,6-dehydratase